MEYMDEEQVDSVEQAFNLDYDVAQAFCSHVVPKTVLLFMGESHNDGMYFEPEYGEGDYGNTGGKQQGKRRDRFALSGLRKENG